MSAFGAILLCTGSVAVETVIKAKTPRICSSCTALDKALVVPFACVFSLTGSYRSEACKLAQKF